MNGEMKNLFKDCKTVSDCEEKLNALIDSWPVVYTHSAFEKPGYWGPIEQSQYDDTHKARLAFIEPIVKEPCKHEPASDRLKKDPMLSLVSTKCLNCGVELKATWSGKKQWYDTHQAKIVFIEQIAKEPCKHEPREWLLLGAPKTLQPVCIHCGAKLKATWSEK